MNIMDEIQKVLVKAGRKDLAQKYYKKVAQKNNEEGLVKKNDEDEEIEEKMLPGVHYPRPGQKKRKR